VLSRIPQLRTPPPYEGGLWGHHASCVPGPRLPAWEGSEAATCLMAPDPTSLLGGLWRRHASRGTGSKHPALEGTGVMTFPATHGERIQKYSPGPRHLQDVRPGGDIMTCKARRSRCYSDPLQ
jgi:hypothetical protein